MPGASGPHRGIAWVGCRDDRPDVGVTCATGAMSELFGSGWLPPLR